MARAPLADFESEVAYRVAFANATLRSVSVGLGSPVHQKLIQAVAAELVGADDAVEMTVRSYNLRIDRSMVLRAQSFDDYLIPGTTILRSRLVDDDHPLGIEDLDLFRAVDAEVTRIRAVDFAITPQPGRLDYDHFRAIHRRLFADIYPWAGEQRVGPESAMIRFAPDTVDFEHGDSAAPMVPYRYYPGPEIAEAVSIQFAQLTHLAERRDLSRDDLVARIGEYAGELIAIHPFRDGNLRAQWLYAMQYDESIGFPIDPFDLLANPEIFDEISHEAYRYQATAQYDGLTIMLDRALTGRPYRRDRESSTRR